MSVEKEETMGELKTRLEKGFRHGFLTIDTTLKAEIELVKYWLKKEGNLGELRLFEEGEKLCLQL